MGTYYQQKNKAQEIYSNEETHDTTGRKFSDYEQFYNKPDHSEEKHINRHLIKNGHDVKTLDVKIMELREQPENLDLLFSIMAMIYSEQEMLFS